MLYSEKVKISLMRIAYIRQMNEEMHDFVSEDAFLIVKHFDEASCQALQICFGAEIFAKKKDESDKP